MPSGRTHVNPVAAGTDGYRECGEMIRGSAVGGMRCDVKRGRMVRPVTAAWWGSNRATPIILQLGNGIEPSPIITVTTRSTAAAMTAATAVTLAP